jgi:hypothetical protein
LTKTAVATPDEKQIAVLRPSCKFHAKSNKDFLALPHATLIWQYRELLSAHLAHPVAPAKYRDPRAYSIPGIVTPVEASGINPAALSFD